MHDSRKRNAFLILKILLIPLVLAIFCVTVSYHIGRVRGADDPSRFGRMVYSEESTRDLIDEGLEEKIIIQVGLMHAEWGAWVGLVMGCSIDALLLSIRIKEKFQKQHNDEKCD